MFSSAATAVVIVLAASLPVNAAKGHSSFDLSKTYTDTAAIYKALLSYNAAHTSKHHGKRDADPSVPDGYELVFGPSGAANNAPGYMGFDFLDTFDVAACAEACNGSDEDLNGGLCKYFNIWQTAVNGTPSAAVCAKYYLATNTSTATNTGDATVTVSSSYGYRRLSALPDGTFEGFSCPTPTPQGGINCYVENFGGWVGTSDAGGFLDATVNFVHATGFAHFGFSFAQLGADATNQFNGTLTTVNALTTEAGKTYTLEFFIRADHAPQPAFPDITPAVDIFWNGQKIAGLSGFFVAYTWQSFQVVATGNDSLVFHGGVWPNVIELDDIYLLLK